jgi:hypothetical protein
LAAWGGFAPGARLPARGYEIIPGKMIVQQRQITAAVPVGVLELPTNLSDRLALPHHLDRRHHPAGVAGNALVRRTFMQGKVTVGVAAYAGDVAAGERLVRMDIIGLRGTIARRMAVKQRGCVSTLAASVNIARERWAGSEIDENADGGCRVVLGGCAEPDAGGITMAKTNTLKVKRIAELRRAASFIDDNLSSLEKLQTRPSGVG